jgi:parvulin-like peptidyl-prolyl isomerase
MKILMKRFSLSLLIILTISLVNTTKGLSSDQKLPVIKGKKIVALVNDELITLEEFNQELASLRTGAKEKKAGREDNAELLRRMINVRLIIQEARKIGLDELPEVKKMVDADSKATLREMLMEQHVKDIKGDEKEVDQFYKEAVREWKIKSVAFDKEDAAKKMEAEIKEGKNFDEVAKRFLSEGTAKGSEENYFKGKDLLPEVAKAVSKMEMGSVSPVIPIKSEFVILKLEDIRYPENPEAKKWARQEALNYKKQIALRNYNMALIKKYVKVNKEVLDRINYQAKEPGFEVLLKDKRVVAEIKGESPVTVGELTDYLRHQFYHGVESATEKKRLDERKIPALEEMVHKRVFRKEALRLGIDKTEAYQNRIKEYENSVIFGAFVEKAVVPDVTLKEEELKTCYNAHIKEYTYPEMMKISSLVFAKRSDAEESIEKLRRGVEFQWLMANAEGQVDKNSNNLLIFRDKLVTTGDLPEELQKIVSGTKPGDLRFYASPEGYYYVLFIQDVVHSKPQPYQEVRETIAKKVYDEKLKKSVEEWAEKLRAVSDVKVYLKDN